MSPFQKLPGWQRRALRTGPVLAVFGALISWPLTAAAVAAVGLLRGGALHAAGPETRRPRGRGHPRAAGRRSGSGSALGQHHGARKHDLAGGLADITKTASVAVKPQIDWNPDYASAEPGERVVTWYPPSGFRADPLQKGQVEDLFQGRVGFEVVPAWNLAAARPCVNFVRARSLPTLLYLKDYAADLAKLPVHQIGLGLDDRGDVVCVDSKVENPHVLMVAGSRHREDRAEPVEGGAGDPEGRPGSRRGLQADLVPGPGGHPGVRAAEQPAGHPGDVGADPPSPMRRWNGGRRSGSATRRRSSIRGWLCIEELGQFSEMTDDWWEELETRGPAGCRDAVFQAPRPADPAGVAVHQVDLLRGRRVRDARGYLRTGRRP